MFVRVQVEHLFAQPPPPRRSRMGGSLRSELMSFVGDLYHRQILRMGLKDVIVALQCVLLGLRDSLQGLWPVVQLIRR